MARENHKCISMGEDQTYPYKVRTEDAEIELDRSHLTKASKLYHQTIEPLWEKKSWKAKKHMKKKSAG